jgi:very-short-patch-repair endonuclease
MWRLLRNRRLQGFKFRRQVPFKNYILDFVCFDRRLVIEVDGSQHASSRKDAVRDSILASEGFRTLRYWNNDVLQRPASVMEDIFHHLSSVEGYPSPGAASGLRPESAPPSPTRGEG